MEVTNLSMEMDPTNSTPDSDSQQVRQRRRHHKSRAGCRACKTRRVKCDEQGPPCVNCVIRKTECTYDYPRSSPSSSQALASDGPLQNDSKARNPLELELLLQWTTVTHKTLGRTRGLYEQRTEITRELLGFDFLLDAIFAMSAIHIADSAEEPDHRKYTELGLEYYTTCCETFRLALENVTKENFAALMLCSEIIVVLRLHAPHLEDDDEPHINRVLSVFELLQMTWSIVHVVHDPVKDGLLDMKLLADGYESQELPTETVHALSRLATINDRFHKSRPDFETYRVCQGAIEALRVWWTKTHVKDHCIALTWLLAEPREFIALIRQGHPVGRLILLYWAVLLEVIRADDQWYNRSVATTLVNELSTKLSTEIGDAEFRNALIWARHKVNLDLI